MFVVQAHNNAIKYRFDDSTINEFLDIAWWDWSAEKITESLELIVGCDLNSDSKVSDF
jgi:virginiamycin A acetyltransferase